MRSDPAPISGCCACSHATPPTIEAPTQAKQSNVVNLMDALRRSIETEKGAKAAEEKPAKKEAPARRAAAKSAKRTSEPKTAEKPTKKRAAG